MLESGKLCMIILFYILYIILSGGLTDNIYSIPIFKGVRRMFIWSVML